MKYTSYTCIKYLLIQFIQLQIQLDSPINFDIFKNIFFSLIVFFIIICTFLCYVCVVHVYYIYIYVIKTLSSGSDCILSAIPHLRILRAAKWFHGGFFLPLRGVIEFTAEGSVCVVSSSARDTRPGRGSSRPFVE